MLGISLLHETRCKAIRHGHAFVPSPGGAALPLHWGHLCPWRTVAMKRAAEERSNLWRDYVETHPQKRPNPDLRGTGYGNSPMPGSLGCPGAQAGAEEVPGARGDAASCLAAACLPHTPGPQPRQRLLATASKCPPRARDGLWHCVVNKRHRYRCSHPQRTRHIIHVCKCTHKLAMLMPAQGLNSHISPPQFTHARSGSLAWGQFAKSHQDINTPKTLTQSTPHPNRCSPARSVGKRCRLVRVPVLLACRRN